MTFRIPSASQRAYPSSDNPFDDGSAENKEECLARPAGKQYPESHIDLLRNNIWNIFTIPDTTIFVKRQLNIILWRNHHTYLIT